MTAEAAPAAQPTVLRTLEIKDIRKAIPHRYPFLLVDRVEVTEEDKKCIGTKMVTINEPFFQGHFPDFPIMPGVLIVEAMAQTACVMLLSKGAYQGKLAVFMGIEEAKFRGQVTPGMVLKMNIDILRLGRAGKFKGEATVDGKLVAEATMTFATVDKEA